MRLLTRVSMFSSFSRYSSQPLKGAPSTISINSNVFCPPFPAERGVQSILTQELEAEESGEILNRWCKETCVVTAVWKDMIG